MTAVVTAGQEQRDRHPAVLENALPPGYGTGTSFLGSCCSRVAWVEEFSLTLSPLLLVTGSSHPG